MLIVDPRLFENIAPGEVGRCIDPVKNRAGDCHRWIEFVHA